MFHFKLNSSGDIKLNTLKLFQSKKNLNCLQIESLKIDNKILACIKMCHTKICLTYTINLEKVNNKKLE